MCDGLILFRIVHDRIVDPPVHELSKYKIVISTLQNVRKLWLAGLEKGFFTHIFIDEAAQVNYVHMSRQHTLFFSPHSYRL